MPGRPPRGRRPPFRRPPVRPVPRPRLRRSGRAREFPCSRPHRRRRVGIDSCLCLPVSRIPRARASRLDHGSPRDLAWGLERTRRAVRPTTSTPAALHRACRSGSWTGEVRSWRPAGDSRRPAIGSVRPQAAAFAWPPPRSPLLSREAPSASDRPRAGSARRPWPSEALRPPAPPHWVRPRCGSDETDPTRSPVERAFESARSRTDSRRRRLEPQRPPEGGQRRGQPRACRQDRLAPVRRCSSRMRCPPGSSPGVGCCSGRRSPEPRDGRADGRGGPR